MKLQLITARLCCGDKGELICFRPGMRTGRRYCSNSKHLKSCSLMVAKVITCCCAGKQILTSDFVLWCFIIFYLALQPIPFMYGIFTYCICIIKIAISMVHVSKYTSPMDAMGNGFGFHLPRMTPLRFKSTVAGGGTIGEWPRPSKTSRRI